MYPFLFVQINQTVSPSSVGICTLRQLIAALVFVIVITSKYYVWAKIRRQDKENKNQATKSTKTNTAKTRLPLAAGDDIKCQTVDQHQGEICKMRVLTAKRAQNTLAYVCLCVYAHFCSHFPLCNACSTHTQSNHTLAILLLLHLLPLLLLILALISLSPTRFACRASAGQSE